jgi:TatD DNase family protein
MWIDSHCHLNDSQYDGDRAVVIERAIDMLEAVLIVGYDLASSAVALKLARDQPKVWAAAGIHPHDAKTWDEATAARLAELLQDPKMVALGEIGLDYHYDYSPRDAQQAVFKAQLDLARRLHKPVIIHDREAHQDTLAILQEAAPGLTGGVMHCYSGSAEMTCDYLKLGFYISFAGPLTFPNALKSHEAAAAIPLDRILVETDAPYLAPVPHRGRRNEPIHVSLVGARLAEIKGLPVAEVMQATTANCKRLFKLDDLG